MWMNSSSNTVKTRTLITMRTPTSMSLMMITLIVLKQCQHRTHQLTPKLLKFLANNSIKLNYMSQSWERTIYPRMNSTSSEKGWWNLLPQSSPKRSRCNSSYMGCLLARNAPARLPTRKWLMKKAFFRVAHIFHTKLMSQENYLHRWLGKIKILMYFISI